LINSHRDLTSVKNAKCKVQNVKNTSPLIYSEQMFTDKKYKESVSISLNQCLRISSRGFSLRHSKVFMVENEGGKR